MWRWGNRSSGKLIDATRADDGDLGAQLERLQEALEGLPADDVVAFNAELNDALSRSYTWELMAAACFLGCGLSADGFLDFRAWLVAQGQKLFDSVLADVDLLATIPYEESPTEEWYCEALHALPSEVLGEDADLPYPFDADTPDGDPVPLTRDALKERYPALWERFGDRFMIGV